MQCDNTLHFTKTDQTQCYNVTIYDDALCEYKNVTLYDDGLCEYKSVMTIDDKLCEYKNEYFQVQIVRVEGSSAVDIDLEYGHTTVYIDDSQEPECGTLLYRYKFENTCYTSTPG